MAASKTPADRQKFWFQFITTPTADTPGTTLLLHFDSRRYFFGRIAEGTQRACIQRGVGLKKVKNIFLTGPTSWDTMGGLIGMILTMADVQAEEKEGAIEGVTAGTRPRINIFGGPKLMHAMACARRFVFRTGMPLSIHETKRDVYSLQEPSYQDENINVWSIPIVRTRSGASSPVLRNGRSGSPTTVNREQALRKDTVNNMFDSDWRKDRLFESRFDQVKLPALIWTRNPETKDLNHFRCVTMEDAPHLSPDSIVLVRNPWPAAMVEELPPADNLSGSTTVSYIVRGQPQRGRFLPQKAKELGVKPGPDYSRLTTGQSVTLDNGSVITSDMVMTETEPGRAMAVFDLPSVHYLPDLSKKLDLLRENQVLVGLKVVSWLLGPGVYESVEFHDLLTSLPDAEHLVSSPDTNSNYIALDSSAASARRLSLIRPGCFLEPIYDNEERSSKISAEHTKDLSITMADRGMYARMSPTVSIDSSEVPPPTDLDKIGVSKDVRALIPQTANEEISTSYDNVEILTLGTGSAVPSKYRNVSATLVRIPGVGSYLFDCGENTLGQLKRTYPLDELDAVLCDLRMIWISHLHADHHLGTMSVILAREDAVRRNSVAHDGSDLYVISEPNMADYLRDFSSIQSASGCTMLSAWNSKLQLKKSDVSVESLPLNIKDFQTVRVSHCHGAQAISVTFANGFKFSYSGDCRPSSSFATIGQDSHVLLHEATFDDGMEGDATAKKHCTTGEALGVAAAMKAKNVVLTHFSQRYQKIPVLTSIKFADQINFEEGDEAEIDGEPDNAVNAVSDIATTNSASNGVAGTGSAAGSLFMKAAEMMNMNVCVAFDQMRIKYSQIPSMHFYYPSIERMFEIEQQKSQLAKAELAAKQGTPGQKKDTPTSSTSKNSSATDLYSKINRGKSSKKNKSENTEGSNTDQAESTNTSNLGLDPAAGATGQVSPPTQSPLSKRAMKRQRAIEEKKEWSRNKQEVQINTSVQNAQGNGIENSFIGAKSIETQTATQSTLMNSRGGEKALLEPANNAGSLIAEHMSTSTGPVEEQSTEPPMLDSDHPIPRDDSTHTQEIHDDKMKDRNEDQQEDHIDKKIKI